MKFRKFSEEQISALKKYYPLGDWDSLFKYFPNQKKANIKGLARRLDVKRDFSDAVSNTDYTGEKRNLLTAICFDHKEKNTVYWKCKCECGNETVIPIYSFLNGSIKSCGCLRHRPAVNAKDFTGQRFGMLTAIEKLAKYKNGETYYRCLCDCGNEKIVYSGNLSSGHTVSCGHSNHKRTEFWKVKHPLDEDTRTYTVYRHISPNGKSYIGITKQEDIEKRFLKGNGYNSQPVFWRAIQKYGWDSFRHEVLEENLTEKEACEKEIYYINEVYHSLAPNGYNTSEGGDSGSDHSKPVIQYYKGEPVNFFESISDASKKLRVAQYTIRSHIGEDKSIGGYYFEQMNSIYKYDIPADLYLMVNENHYDISKVVAKELSAITIKRNLKGSKPVNKYDLEGHYICTFPSIASACESIDGSKSNAVCAAVNPNRQGDIAYGYLWRYDTGDHSDISPHRYKKKRSVLQIDAETGDIINEYPSISVAARSLKTGNNQIAEACRGERETLKGCKWRFK